MQLTKGYKVTIRTYNTQEVKRYSKTFLNENDAVTYRVELDSAVWNSPVTISLDPVYMVSDGETYYQLDGNFVRIST